jgi:hypothetical protein
MEKWKGRDNMGQTPANRNSGEWDGKGKGMEEGFFGGIK